MTKDFDFKSISLFFLKLVPCLSLMYYSINITSFLLRNIIFVGTSTYILILLLSKNNIIIPSILGISYIIIGAFNNLGFQKEITYLQLIQFSTLFLFSLYFSTNNKILKKKIKQKDNTINRDYTTGLFNKKYFDELIMTDYSPRNKETYMLSIEIDNFKNIMSNIGYTSSQKLLRDVSNILRKESSNKGICFRIDGETFILLIDKSDNINIQNLVENLKYIIENTSFKTKKTDISLGVNISVISSHKFKNPYEYLDSSIQSIKNAKYNKDGIYIGLKNEYQYSKQYN